MSRFSLFCLLTVFVCITGCGESETGGNGPSDASKSTDRRVPRPSDAPVERSTGIKLVAPEAEEAASKAAEELDSRVLIVGSNAPAISIVEWLKGEPITELKPDQIYVVEFWATWCGPCKATMPHLAALQNEYGDKVQFIGVTDEDAQTVRPFLEEKANGTDKTWSEVLTYRIALDKDGETNAAFMQAAEQAGIPCAFVVGKTGKIEWIGHPAEMDEPLSQIVAGTWDLTSVAAAAKMERAMEAAKMEAAPLIGAALNDKDYPKAIRLIEGLMQRFPKSPEFPLIRLQFQIQGNLFDQANENAKTLIETAKDDAEKLSQLAWMMATGTNSKGIDLDLAASAAEKAVQLTEEKNADYIDTFAQVKFRQGLLDDAIALQKKAIEVAPPQIVEGFKEHLQEMEAAAAQKSESK